MSPRRKRHTPEQIIRKLRDADAMLAAVRLGHADHVAGPIVVHVRPRAVDPGDLVGRVVLARLNTPTETAPAALLVFSTAGRASNGIRLVGVSMCSVRFTGAICQPSDFLTYMARNCLPLPEAKIIGDSACQLGHYAFDGE